MTLTDRPEAVADTVPVTTPLLAPTYRWATIGMVSLVFLAAFEALAVTTIMPSVSADLHGRAWFSAAFSATLAASVVGMVAGGLWSDRSGPRLPLLASVAVFAGGLLLAGLAPGIELFVAARFLQGLGGGAMTVALYVVVARIYAPIDHPRIFGAFAAAWVIPSMVGPSVAGVVLEAFGWRWVFLGVVALAVAATGMLLPALRGLADNPEPSSVATRGRLALSVVVAGAVVGLDLAGRASAGLGFAAAVVALVVVLLAVRPLLPAGTLVVRRGLPGGGRAARCHRGDVLRVRDLPALPAPGALRRAAVAVRSDPDRRRARLGRRLAGAGPPRCPARPLRRAPDRGRAPAAGIAGELVATVLQVTPVLIGAAWVLAGAGMGLMFPRISAVVLAASDERDQGRNSAAMSISDAVGGATAISLTGLVFTAVGPASEWAPFVAVLALTSALALGALLVSRRTELEPVLV